MAGWLGGGGGGGGGMLVMMCCGSLEFFSNMGPHKWYTFTYPYSHLPSAGITYASLQMSITITTLYWLVGSTPLKNTSQNLSQKWESSPNGVKFFKKYGNHPGPNLML